MISLIPEKVLCSKLRILLHRLGNESIVCNIFRPLSYTNIGCFFSNSIRTAQFIIEKLVFTGVESSENKFRSQFVLEIFLVLQAL